MCKLYNFLFMIIFAISLAFTASTALADYRHHGGSHFSIIIGTPYPAYYPYRYYYRHSYPQYRHCQWMQGHVNRFGNWVPGHHVCW